MDNCRISCQVMADMKKIYNDLTIINLYDPSILKKLRSGNGNTVCIYRPMTFVLSNGHLKLILTSRLKCQTSKNPIL